MSDPELLDQYRTSGSRDALAELVRHHAGWVHGVALRRVRDAQLADDVMQAAFIVLMKKPPRLKHETALGPWLFRVVCHISQRVIRDQQRRQRREKAFAMQHPETGPADESEMTQQQWEQLAPHLDDAVLKLSDVDRQIVLLRFYQSKSHIEVAELLGISHEAARQRTGRAVAKLREILNKRGVQVPGVAATIAAMETHAAPQSSAAMVNLRWQLSVEHQRHTRQSWQKERCSWSL